MRIHSNGYVGIGTKAPTQKLDVDGKIRIRDGANNGYIAVSEPDGTMTWTCLLYTSPSPRDTA